MSWPAVEVADILHAQGSRFLDRYEKSFDFQQLKAFRAIPRCRTTALGGHIDACPRCGYQAAISYNSCLMGSDLLWGLQRQEGMLHTASRPFESPLRFALQEREQFVGRSELPLAETRRYDRFNGLKLFGGISPNVGFRRGQVTVPQPKGDFPDVVRRLQHDHGSGVSEHVGRDLFAVQRRTFSICRFGVTPQNVRDSPPAEGFTASVHKELRRSDRTADGQPST